MKEEIRTITTTDSHTLDCFLVTPDQPAKGGLVVLQEIFGVTEQLKNISRQYCELGYSVALPALYDRHERDTVFPFDQGPQAMALMDKTDLSQTLLDIDASIACLKKTVAKVAVMGFCWGGGLALRSAQKLNVSGGIVFYGTRLTSYLDSPLIMPVIGHFGDDDAHVPEADLKRVKRSLPQLEAHIYEAGHAFANDARDAYREAAAMLAHERNALFLQRVLA